MRPGQNTVGLGTRIVDRLTELTHPVRRVRRASRGGTPEFDLAYLRTGPESLVPTVIIPGGPGLASTLPYGSVRRQATADGLDLIMIDHRGVGLSRSDLEGKPLPVSAMWVDDVLDDIAGVLDAEGVEKANIVGSSYGSYLASAFGQKYPERVAGMLLDSALQSPRDIEIERETIRGLFWDSDSEMASIVRELVECGEDQRVLLDVIRAGFELCGPEAVLAIMRLRRRGRKGLAWRALASYAARDASIKGIPDYYEFARTGAIGFRELDYGAVPDGLPLDPALTYSQLAGYFPPFDGERRDLVAAAEQFDWPLVLLSGDRDIRTPAAIAQRTAELAPDAAFVQIQNGHSALDTHPVALLKAAKLLAAGRARELPALGAVLSRLPKQGGGALFARAVCLLARASKVGL